MNGPRLLSITDINHMDEEPFVVTVGRCFEQAEWIARDTWQCRPFHDITDLHRKLTTTMRSAPRSIQLDLLRGHPDLVGRLAREGTLTPESTGEQAAAGLTALPQADIERFDRYNQAYRDRFGFPFIICARENQREAILAEFRRRLLHSVDQELEAALDEVNKIAWWRLWDIVSER